MRTWSPAKVMFTSFSRRAVSRMSAQVSAGWGEEAVGELDVSDQVVVVKDTGDSARLV
jgi:hypothetical protein